MEGTNLVEPCSLSKMQNDRNKSDVTGEDELGGQLICAKCTKCIDNVIQCKRCEHWYQSKCTGLPSTVMAIVFLYKQLQQLCEACDKAAIDAILEPAVNNSNVSMHKDFVKDIVTQIGEVIKEANKCVKKTLSETLHGSVPSDDMVMEADNVSNTSLSYSKATSDVITSFLDEDKERSKRQLNVKQAYKKGTRY